MSDKQVGTSPPNHTTIGVPFGPGDTVVLLGEVDMDSDGGFMADTVFEGTVDQYVPGTGKLSFEDSDVGRAEFLEMLEDAGGVQVLH